MSRAAFQQEEVYQRVRHRLSQGEGGSVRSLSRRKLAAELGVSAACIRTILQRLESEGLIESRPKSGTRLRQVDPTAYHEMHDLRELIEPYAARRAAWWITRPQLEILRQSCDQCAKIVADLEGKYRVSGQSARSLKQGMAMEAAFHGTILEAAQNRTAMKIVDNLRFLSFMGYYAKQLPPAAQLMGARQTLRGHQAISAAIAAGDADEAERQMRLHIHHARNRSHAGLPLAELRALQTS
jgi:DNA-binding GntR family transcriptional regulator